MDLIADRGRRVTVEELNTSRLLAHARKQAVQRKLDGVPQAGEPVVKRLSQCRIALDNQDRAAHEDPLCRCVSRFGSLAAPARGVRGFASQSLDWFAVVDVSCAL